MQGMTFFAIWPDPEPVHIACRSTDQTVTPRCYPNSDVDRHWVVPIPEGHTPTCLSCKAAQRKLERGRFWCSAAR
mgnify:CR=1 FL=1